ncbi:MAG: hypothetical protein U0350_37930 [Caldilineaceae bacterium]
MTDTILPALQSFNKVFLTGPFGSGKTTLAIERIRWLLRQERIRGDDILVLTPQRTLAQPYLAVLRGPNMPSGTPVQVTTFAGLARHAVELYWPLLATVAEFADAKREPTFLNLETSQYHMARFVDAALERGEFDGVHVERSRVISQVLDNLNKTALQGFTIAEAYERLELAVPSGEHRTARLNALRAARRISEEFRQLCHQATLIDFSLQVELFNKHVLTNDWSRVHLFRTYKHLLFDNSEEDTISAQRLVKLWLPQLDSALILADDEAGYRLFLGADPEGAKALTDSCEQQLRVEASRIMSPGLLGLAHRIDRELGKTAPHPSPPQGEGGVTTPSPWGGLGWGGSEERPLILPGTGFRFYPQMIRWVAEEVKRLVLDRGVAPGEIAVLAPFVSDALRFSLQTALQKDGIMLTTHRPSRALEVEPAARCLLTLACLAHPHWGIRPATADVTLALTLSIQALDPVRAHLLSRVIYPERRGTIELGRFGELVTEMQQRITYTIGQAYDRLRDWIYAYRAQPDVAPLDQFFAQIFGEVLSQPGYGFHNERDAARVANQLVESARNFRWAMEGAGSRGQGARLIPRNTEYVNLGREYLKLVESGALGALYVPGWRIPEDAVFLAPAYTYLMRNRAVDVQFWLDIGAGGWWERLYQPLTHPYVLSHRWPDGKPWTDFDEYTTRQQTMHRLLLGLIRRARQRIYLGISDYSESGFEQRGPLLALINRLLVQERGQA